jgi:transposase-like protein
VERGLRYEQGLLCIIDGSEGLRKAMASVFGALGTSLKTTNCLESLNALVGQRTDKVDYWRTSDQKHRWLAAALLDIEPRLRRIRGYGSLPLLRTALQMEIRGQEGRAEHRAA